MRRYTGWMALTLILGLLTSAAVNYRVDPMQLFHLASSSAKTLSRVEQFPNMRMYKPLHMSQQPANALIIGSSRTGGFSPTDTGWKDVDAYNASLPGMTIQEMNHFLRYAHALRPVKELLLGIDYERIVSPLPRSRPGFVAARTPHPVNELHSLKARKQRFLDYYTALFSTQFLNDSLIAATDSGPHLRRYHVNGWWEPTSDELSGQGGYIFALGNRLRWGEQYPIDPQPNLAALEDMLAFCYASGIRTRIVLTPAHVSMVDMWQHLSGANMWRQTHLRLLQINRELADQHQTEPFQVWGFGHESKFVAEPIYRTRDIHKAWFSDGIHPRPKLAKSIVSSIYLPEAEYGMRLDPAVLDDYLSKIDSLRRDFIDKNRDQMMRLYERAGHPSPNW
ncbi:MAG: hypothetical protein ABJL54_05770 [Halioglobus sp.]